jgi:phage shock protein C
MYCTQCGIELREADRFCSQCGHRTAVAGDPLPARPLMLDKANKKIAGVCSGFARFFDVDVTLVRVIWLALALGTGVGFIAYAVAWMIVPSDRGMMPRMLMAPAPNVR